MKNPFLKGIIPNGEITNPSRKKQHDTLWVFLYFRVVKKKPGNYNSNRAICRCFLWGIEMIFHVKIEKAEDGWFVVECPALPGCVSQGKDEKEALENIKEAIIAWLWAEDQKAAAVLSQSTDCQPVVVAV
jgi:predicted RNase H-like HicB family nuclease